MSKRKDARWQYAYFLAEAEGLEFKDYTCEEWQERLDEAERFLVENPHLIEPLAEKWNSEA